MVILDEKNKTYGLDTNLLYLSFYDIDYLVNKYGVELLKGKLPESYIEGFLNILDLVKNEEELSCEYYAIAPLAITYDEIDLLDIISREISEGNMFTKSQLCDLAKENLNIKIFEIKNKAKENNLTAEELYKLRTYSLIEFVETARKKAKLSDYLIFNGIDVSMEIRKKNAEIDYDNYTSILNAVGLNENISESNYFEKYIPLMR